MKTDPIRHQLALGVGGFDTTLRFDNRDVDVRMTAVTVSKAFLLDSRWTTIFTIGALVGGDLQVAALKHDARPGALVSAAFEYRARPGYGLSPSLDLSGSLSASWLRTEDPLSDRRVGYLASDLRFGARAGWSVASELFPYLALRVFGGPVFWELDGESVVGSDIHHYQIAAGVSGRIGRLAVFAEGAGFGERTLATGLSFGW